MARSRVVVLTSQTNYFFYLCVAVWSITTVLLLWKSEERQEMLHAVVGGWGILPFIHSITIIHHGAGHNLPRTEGIIISNLQAVNRQTDDWRSGLRP